MKHICVLLNGEIKNDSRVIKTIKTISAYSKVDLYYLNGNSEDAGLFNENVTLFSFERESDNLMKKIIRHTFFYNEYMFFVKEVIAKEIKYDYVFANDLPCLKPASLIKRRLSAKLIYDSHEIYIETLNQFFPQNSSGIKSVAFRFVLWIMKVLGTNAERRYLKDADYFITVGGELKRYFESKYNFKGIKILMNCPVLTAAEPGIDLKLLLNIPDSSKLFIYQGVLNSGRGLKLLVEAFKYVNNNLYLLILGSGMIKPELVEYVQKNGLGKRVFFMDKVDTDVLPLYTAAADFGINLLEDINLSKKYAVPNKLFEYIHAGIPVISSNSPESVNVYKKYNVGILVGNNVPDISNAINSISESDNKMYLDECKKAAMEYNWGNQEKVLKEIVI